MPWRWKPWLFQLLLVNMIAPLLFITRLEAQVALAVTLLGGATFVVMTAFFGFTRIICVSHISWLPLIIWLAFRSQDYPLAGASGVELAFAIWMRLVIVLDAGSLALDTINVINYFRGNRAEFVPGLSADASPSVEPSKCGTDVS